MKLEKDMLMGRTIGKVEEENGEYISSKYTIDMYYILKESRELKNRLGLHDVLVGKSTCCPIMQTWQPEFDPWNPHKGWWRKSDSIF